MKTFVHVFSIVSLLFVNIFSQNQWIIYSTANSGLPHNEVRDLEIDNNGSIWIGTMGGGIAVYNETGIVSVDEGEFKKLPTDYFLFQNYPNPFNPTTRIKFDLPKSSHVLLRVFDLLGQEKTTLVDKELSSGYHEIEFDAGNLPSGIYFYRLEAEGFIQTKKMILVR
jgi:hypothetical protein